ncbi:hypothetical protein CRN44_07880 [Vibrio vulnificus]|nr:hypothetical protein Y702_02360 [Vibrio vulnificus BAA87]KFK69105.1 hypothetical protein JS85_10925 [Vibrio vulnificus]POC44329.1 hypothetical protein CRN45_22155 [Vibrio vulnificus]POC64429.1 hypothetical protein CRN44_07880 [Vibrio vulnificus]
MIHGDSQCFSRLYAIKKHWLAVLWATQHFREMNHGKAMVCVYGLIAFQSFETQKSFFQWITLSVVIPHSHILKGLIYRAFFISAQKQCISGFDSGWP